MQIITILYLLKCLGIKKLYFQVRVKSKLSNPRLCPVDQKKQHKKDETKSFPIKNLQVFLPWISPESRVMESVESVVVGDHDVGAVVQEEGQHVVALLRNRVVQCSVAFGILKTKQKHFEKLSH
jgi:hypothetical protein